MLYSDLSSAIINIGEDPESPADSEPIVSTAMHLSAIPLSEVAERLFAIFSARVADAGDGTILLRIDEPAAELEHGNELNIHHPAEYTSS